MRAKRKEKFNTAGPTSTEPRIRPDRLGQFRGVDTFIDSPRVRYCRTRAVCPLYTVGKADQPSATTIGEGFANVTIDDVL